MSRSSTYQVAISVLILMLWGWGCEEEETKPSEMDLNPVVDTSFWVVGTSATTATLQWMAPSPDWGPPPEQAGFYDIRYAEGSLDFSEGDWETAHRVEDEPDPKLPGQIEEFVVTGLSPLTHYSFAVMTIDQDGYPFVLTRPVSARTGTEEDVHWWGGFASHPEGQGLSGWGVDMVVYDDALLVAGEFYRLGEPPNDARIGRWDGSSWSAVIEDYRVSVGDLLVYKGELIVEGWFIWTDEIPGAHIARWDGATWRSLGSGLDGRVLSMTVYGDELVVAGTFDQAGGVDSPRIASWDGTQWNAISEGPLRYPYHVLGMDDFLYAGGRSFEGDSLLFVTRWDGEVWDPILKVAHDRDSPQAWRDDLFSLGQYRNHLVAIYMLGLRLYLREWDGKTWLPPVLMPYEVQPLGPYEYEIRVRGLLEFGGELIVASEIIPEGFVLWNGAGWSTLGSGVTTGNYQTGTRVNAAALFGDKLYLTGNFGRAGGKQSVRIARWDR